MDSKELLTSTRTQFMRAFLAAVRATIPPTKEDLFRKADASYTSADQSRLLYARTLLEEKNDQIVELLYTGMERLLNRSFQTTYNSFHKPSALDASADQLSLVDANAFEDELRINVVTARFRSEGEEQLRDLNIRIALMFGQDNIKERENPFRPYLLTRCISTGFEGLGANAELASTLAVVFSEHFAAAVSDIYRSVNVHLAGNGVAAQLQLKIQKSPTAPGTSGNSVLPDDGGEQSFGGGRVAHVGAGAAAKPRVGVEQLYAAVRGTAGATASGGRADGDGAGGDGGGGDGGGGDSGDHDGPAGNGAAPPHHGDDAGGHAGATPGWLSGNQAVGHVLRKFFSRNSGTQAGPQAGDDALAYGETPPHHPGSGAGGRGPGAPGHAPRLAQSLRQLQQRHTPVAEDMFTAHGEVRNLIMEQRLALTAASQNIDEQMTIDVVAMLFEFILRDSQVPAEVRAQLGRLQFIVLKVALRDASLLTQKGHPARMLVNRIGSISLGLQQIEPSGAHITQEICRIVDTLLKDEEEDAELFSRLLDEFDAFIAVELRVGDQRVERTIGAVERVQNRALSFAHTAAHLGEALHGLMIDPFLKAFLENHWVHAVEVAGWNDAERALRFRQLVPDLLWSILTKPTMEQRAQLFGMLPQLLKSLRDGLTLTSMAAPAQQELLNWLVAAHTSALRTGGNTVTEPLSLATIHEHFRHYIEDPEDGAPPADYANTPHNHQLISLAIKALDLDVTMLDPVFEAALPGEPNGGDDGPDPAWTPELARERLRSGVAIEINLGANKTRGRLNWIDPALSQLVLSLEGATSPSMISVRMFLRLVRRDQVRFLEAEPLFERAVESLLASADGLDRAS